ncbi:helix-turn-helix transcriptional regulator [Clostridium sp. C2-6-12]|uniref:helix-turn-helix domain-containing protein n=1 Tax=Clostridium sp. C2-6-12 TaxID=2698832 RepID=UPI00136EAC2D|nr:helix-turn-helix transcriptional regulator [Clostridium sp. C2-6-12]
MNDLGERIKKLRTEKGWSLDDLALKSSVPKTTIWGIEKGSKPSYDKVENIAKAFKIDVHELMGKHNALVSDASTGNIEIIDTKQRALQAVRDILSYAIHEDKIDNYTLLDKETELILEATANNIVSMVDMINHIPFAERAKIYCDFEMENE